MRFGNLLKFLICILLIFLNYLLQDFLFQSLGVATWGKLANGSFMAAFNVFWWLIFWYCFRHSLASFSKLLFIFLITVVFTSLPNFIFKQVLPLDYENLILKSVCYFVPFAVFLVLKGTTYKPYILPFFMALIPLVNLEIANGFSGNLAFFNVLFHSGQLQLQLTNGIVLDLGMATIQAFFWGVIAILFYEISNQSFVSESWRLQVELPLSKGYFIAVFILFKTMIYWLLGSMIIVVLGDSALPLFSNKVALVLNGIGFLGILTICTLYFRKYMTLYFYDKCGHSNWLYPFFFLPIADIAVFLVFIFIPARKIKQFFQAGYSKNKFVCFIAVVLLAYAGYEMIFQILKLPDTQQGVKTFLWISQVFIPVISVLGIVFSLKYKMVHRVLITFFFCMLPWFYWSFDTELLNAIKIERVVGLISTYLNIALLIAFLYPVLNFESFIGINKR